MTIKWDKYQENVLRKWSSMSKTYSIMHSLAAEYWNKWDKRLGIPVVLLGTVTASSIFTINSEIDDNNLWKYVNGGMVLLMTGISGISKFLGTHEKHTKHESAAFKYTQISMNIDTLLSFPRSDREKNPRQFINKIKVAILEIREYSPNIPTWIISEYIKKLDKTIINTQTQVNKHYYPPIEQHIDAKQINNNNSTSNLTEDKEDSRNELLQSKTHLSENTDSESNTKYITGTANLDPNSEHSNSNRTEESENTVNIRIHRPSISNLPIKKDVFLKISEDKKSTLMNKDDIYTDTCPVVKNIINISHKLECDSQSESESGED